MNNINIDDYNYLEASLTPWNDQSLGIKTNEINKIVYSDENHLNTLIKIFINKSRDLDIQHSSIRIHAWDKNLKKYLQNNNFYFVETSILYVLKNFKKVNFNSIIKAKVILEKPNQEDFIEIANIAKESVQFGKFHEDYNIDFDLAKDRFYNWIIDMQKQEKRFLIARSKNGIKSFIAYEINDGKLVLLLGGSKEVNSAHTYYFWSSFMEYFKKYDVKDISALVSVDNMGIMNLYAKFGFKAEKTFFGFHKIYR